MKTVLITGSTKGIGKATALQLAKKGWHVIIHGRKILDCEEILSELTASTGNSNIDYVTADLSDLEAVRHLANEVIEKFSNLNCLILNAGTFSANRKITKDGLEYNWTVNYLSRFLLSQLLLETLKSNAPSRIVDISGMYHKKGHIYFEDLSLEKNYSLSTANNQSKLANVLFTHRFAKELKGTGVTINTLHPGAVNSGSIIRSSDFSGFAKFMYKLTSIFFKTPEKGAATSVYLATSPEVENISGNYFSNQKEQKSSAESLDPQLQEQLWNWSMKFLKEYQYL